MKAPRLLREANRDIEAPWLIAGEVDGCDFYINIYGRSGAWHYTIRCRRAYHNLIVGTKTFVTLHGAAKHASKWALVQLLRQIDPSLFRSYKGDNSICWVESI